MINSLIIPLLLTHRGRVMHMCVCNLTIIGSDYGLWPGQCQVLIWTNAGILLIGPIKINSSEILFKIQTFLFKKNHLNVSSAKWRPFCLSLNELIIFLLTSFITMPQIAKFMGPTRGPPGSCRPQMGPMLAPWTLLSGAVLHTIHQHRS